TLQPGRGAFSGVLAHLAALELDNLEMFLTFQYRWRSIGVGGSDFDFGDTFSVSTSAAYRFVKEEHPGSSLSLSLGLSYSYTSPHRDNGDEVGSSGSRVINLTPAWIWHPTVWWDMKLSVNIPVFRDVNGTQAHAPYSISLGLGRRF
ncbi:MAG: hypothetical protein OEY28_08670, partial [Nitrospira sp.]|nr:hypothetical protein [Nitrospira sp.]